jgi:heat shock protein 5
MVQEAKEFPNEDEAQRTYIKALNALSLFVYHLKGQLGDQEGHSVGKSKLRDRLD